MPNLKVGIVIIKIILAIRLKLGLRVKVKER
jgi:hypothetical protein